MFFTFVKTGVIMTDVHSHSTYDGHYFAYINLSGNKWYKFDDENLNVVSKQKVTEKQFGSSRQSVYMLVHNNTWKLCETDILGGK